MRSHEMLFADAIEGEGEMPSAAVLLEYVPSMNPAGIGGVIPDFF